MLALFDKVSARLRREARVGIERTIVYRRTEAPSRMPAAAGLTIRPLEGTEVHQLASLGPFDPDEAATRFARGDRCMSAGLGEELVHYSWVQVCGVHAITSAGVDAPIPDGELWIYNCRTSQAHRGLRIYPTTLTHILGDAFERGARCAWIYAAESNVASHRGIERAGFELVTTLHALRFGRFVRPVSHWHI
jgi:RimJ/RimL family protein N-acetyltransferase